VQTRHCTHHSLTVKPVPDVRTNKGSAEDTPVQVDPDLGVLRTMMAADQTLMAWIRTSLSMFTFGYSLYKNRPAKRRDYAYDDRNRGARNGDR
jgi:uncharacterized membrane protein YidH (DUF202 family)